MGRNVWVSPRSNGWAVQKVGAKRASAIVPRQKDAIDIGRRAATNERAELIVQGRHGAIRQKDSHGRDKYPPRG